jgi:5-methylcytosine-specific restriction endonuclease McrA
MSVTKAMRQQVYEKYGGHCAYCGRQIEYKEMQVDHIEPQRLFWAYEKGYADRIENLNPSCRRCNHYILHNARNAPSFHRRNVGSADEIRRTRYIRPVPYSRVRRGS